MLRNMLQFKQNNLTVQFHINTRFELSFVYQINFQENVFRKLIRKKNGMLKGFLFSVYFLAIVIVLKSFL